MLKILNNTFRKRFALKLKKRDSKCQTINYTVEFYQNLIDVQSQDLSNLLRIKNFPVDFNFCMNTLKINDILKDPNIEELALSRLSGSITRQGVKSESTFYQILDAFYENLKYNPEHPLSKELKESLDKNSFLFTAKEKKRLYKILTEEKQNLPKKISNPEDLLDDADLAELEQEYGNAEMKDRSSSSDSGEENIKDLKETKGYKKLVKNNELKSIEKKQRPLSSDEILKINKTNSNLDENANSEIYIKKYIDPVTGDDLVDTEAYGKQFIYTRTKLTLKDENIKLFLHPGSKKASIKSSHFFSKIKILGINDNISDNILEALDHVDKLKPNIILLQKRPMYYQNNNFIDLYTKVPTNEDSSSPDTSFYKSLLLRDDILTYYKEILSKRSEFKVNTVEKLVYQEKDTLKTISYANSIIMKCNYSLNTNPNLKIILTDIPIFMELENLMKNIFNKFNPRDLFLYMKYNLLFERYLWLMENCNKSCPVCDSNFKLESIHQSLEEIVDEFQISFQGIEHPKIKNISQKIINSILIEDFKGNNIVSFVEEKYFYLVIERLVRDINSLCDGKTFDEISEEFRTRNIDEIKNRFLFESRGIESLVDFISKTKQISQHGDDKKSILTKVSSSNVNLDSPDNLQIKNEFLNKLAICLNIYQDKKIMKDYFHIPELENMKESLKAPLKDLCEIYNRKLNFVDEINIWNSRKYDYKCFPNEILINKFIENPDKNK